MNRIKQLREHKGLSQEALGQLLGTTRSAVSKYESGKIPLNDELILKLTDLFNVSSDFLLGKDPVLTDEQRELYEEILKLDSDSIQKVLEYAEFLKSRRKKK